MIKIGEATAKARIEAPITSIHLTDWLFTMSSEDYAACAKGHHSAAQGMLPSGKRVSVNLEYVAGFFMVQHYIETVSEPAYVKVVSPNTLLWGNDDTFVMAQITWELSVVALDDHSCELTCIVTSETDNAALARQAHESSQDLDGKKTPLQLHIHEETPHFAKDIERKALANRLEERLVS